MRYLSNRKTFPLAVKRRLVLTVLVALCAPVKAQTLPDSDNRSAGDRSGPADADAAYIGFLFGSSQREPSSFEPGLLRHAPVVSGDVRTRQRVRYETADRAGTILIDTRMRRLYLIETGGYAQSYAVGVGREGFGWQGTQRISAKRRWPDWHPPADMLARRPDLPRRMAGGVDNPLGARALYLGDTLYRIHGSNEPETVGQEASSGCFRMTNSDVADLYARVSVGSLVKVF